MLLLQVAPVHPLATSGAAAARQGYVCQRVNVECGWLRRSCRQPPSAAPPPRGARRRHRLATMMRLLHRRARRPRRSHTASSVQWWGLWAADKVRAALLRLAVATRHRVPEVAAGRHPARGKTFRVRREVFYIAPWFLRRRPVSLVLLVLLPVGISSAVEVVPPCPRMRRRRREVLALVGRVRRLLVQRRRRRRRRVSRVRVRLLLLLQVIGLPREAVVVGAVRGVDLPCGFILGQKQGEKSAELGTISFLNNDINVALFYTGRLLLSQSLKKSLRSKKLNSH